MVEERLPVASLGQQAQPAQFQAACLRQVAVLGEELVQLAVAGAAQASIERLVGQVGLQRIAA